jgi:multidrug efflux pump subunit AcrA (membrane-fusion protein)
MFITSANPKAGVIVPEKTIVQSEENSYVYVVVAKEDGTNQAVLRKVTLGESYSGKQVIKDGVKAGDKILVGGLSNRLLRDGALVNIVTEE